MGSRHVSELKRLRLAMWLCITMAAVSGSLMVVTLRWRPRCWISWTDSGTRRACFVGADRLAVYLSIGEYQLDPGEPSRGMDAQRIPAHYRGYLWWKGAWSWQAIPTGLSIGCPLWAVLTPSAVSAVWLSLAVRRRERARLGRCAACGYDRAGLNATRPCPECGLVP